MEWKATGWSGLCLQSLPLSTPIFSALAQINIDPPKGLSKQRFRDGKMSPLAARNLPKTEYFHGSGERFLPFSGFFAHVCCRTPRNLLFAAKNKKGQLPSRGEKPA
jgi:hypothetical protein